MADPIILTKALTAAAATNIALSQSPIAAGNLTINGAAASGGVATLDTQRRVLITSGGDDRTITFTVYGTNDAGVSISEVVTGSNASTAVTLQDFKTVTRVALSGGAASTVTVGTNGVGSSPWFVPNFHITPFSMEFQATLTGTANFSIELTETSPLVPIYPLGVGNAQPTPTPFSPAGFTALSATAVATLTFPVQAWRLTVNSGTGQIALSATQAGIRN